MEIRKIPISDINPAPYNPRKDLKPGDAEYEKLKRSIDEFDLVEPLVWNEATGNLVGGHQRLKILIDRGDTEVEVSVVSLNSEKEKALNIALNKIQGDWDYDKLEELLKDLDDKNFDVTLTGFDASEVDRILSEIGNERENEKEEIAIEERAHEGDVWQLGNHRIVCADCTDIEALNRLFGGEKVNTIVTSPPYAEQRKDEYGGIPADEYPEWFCMVADVLRQYLVDTGSFFVNIKEHAENGQRSLYVMKMAIDMVEKYGWKYIDEFVWVKVGLPAGFENRLKNEFEPVFWFAKSDNVDIVERYIEEGAGDDDNIIDEFGKVYHFSKQEKITFHPEAVGKESDGIIKKSTRNKSKTGDVGVKGIKAKGVARPGNVVKVHVNNESWKHPAMYPVGLPEFFIKLTTTRGDKVLDPFLGAGSTLIAAEKTKRICYGVERMPKYVDIILARWEELTGQKAVRLNE